MLMGGIHPVLWMLMPGFIAIFAGIPFMLMAAKVRKPGAVFLMGLITGLIYSLGMVSSLLPIWLFREDFLCLALGIVFYVIAITVG